MSGSELNSTFSEILVRVQVRGFVRLANDSGGPALVTFIWSADNPDGIIFVVTMGERAETWMFGHDLLKRGIAARGILDEPIGDGLVTVFAAAGAQTLGVTLRSPQNSESWMKVFVHLPDVARVLDAIDSRMLNAPPPDIEAEIMAWFMEGEES